MRFGVGFEFENKRFVFPPMSLMIAWFVEVSWMIASEYIQTLAYIPDLKDRGLRLST